MIAKKVFSEAMAGLCEIYEREPTALLVKTYYEVLKDIPEADFKKAISGIMRCNTYKKLPRPAEILEAVYGRPEDKAALAIAKIENAWNNGIGIYENVVFDDPIIHAIISSYGGWIALCQISDTEWKFTRRELEKHYRALSSTHPAHLNAPPVLWGLHGSTENMAKLELIGKAPKISYIGDQKAAIAWSQPKAITQ